MERILRLSDDELRDELSSKGYYPPPIQDDITRKILRRKLAILIDPSLVIDEPVQNSDSSCDSDTTNIHESQNVSVRLRNRVRFSEPQEEMSTVTGERTHSAFRYTLEKHKCHLSVHADTHFPSNNHYVLFI
ncbi:hypothetical protein MN116_005602 [Schistosoma mekongi]|uniref:LEM domain-containing protein n=1 Tax=Schistosoma mekongi TaxID=38744 RepID=A0AAE1ZAF2_SCHME|nr:hypothetical protein MN116_005602 [Schistosoma mekongi]